MQDSVVVMTVLSALLGAVAGRRSMTAPAAMSWAAWLGWITLDGSWLAFLAEQWALSVLTVFALGELVADKLPSVPSRTIPPAFAFRVVSGAVAGAALLVMVLRQ